MKNLANVLSGSKFIAGLFVGILLVGCAHASFNYKFYKPMLTDWNGTLLGATAADDLPASDCSPDANNDGKCVILKSDEFFKLKADYLNQQQQLIDLQRICH